MCECQTFPIGVPLTASDQSWQHCEKCGSDISLGGKVVLYLGEREKEGVRVHIFQYCQPFYCTCGYLFGYGAHNADDGEGYYFSEAELVALSRGREV